MSDLRQDPPNVLETTRITGGVSARIVAVAVVGVLTVVVWIGISGRLAPTVPASVRPDVALVSTPSPGATEDPTSTPAPVSSATPESTATPRPGVAFQAVDHFSVVATVGNQQFVTMLESTGQGGLSGVFSVPIPPPATEGTLELAQVWSTVSHDAWLTLATWDLRLESLSAASGREYVVLDRSVRARPSVRNVPLPVLRGYRITVRAQSGVPRALLSVDIELGPRRQLVGDDGIFGWPVTYQIRSHRPVARMRGAYNRCRWDIGPLAAPPRPGTDEENC